MLGPRVNYEIMERQCLEGVYKCGPSGRLKYLSFNEHVEYLLDSWIMKGPFVCG